MSTARQLSPGATTNLGSNVKVVNLVAKGKSSGQVLSSMVFMSFLNAQKFLPTQFSMKMNALLLLS